MKESILSGLVLAAITGATFVAYNHPAAYYAVARKIGLGLLIIFIGTVFFEFSGSFFLVGLAPRLHDPAARKIVEDFKADMWAQVGIVQISVIGLCVFGFFLGWVAKLKAQKGAGK